MSHNGLSSLPSPSPGCLKELSLIHISYFSAVWADQCYLSSCTHQALCQTPRGLAGLPEAQSPAELLCTNPAWEPGRGRGTSSPGKVLQRSLEKARSETDSGGWKEKACLPTPPPPSWAASLLPPSRRPGHSCQLPSATSPLTHQRNQQRLHSYFLASRCCHLCTKGVAPCLCL